MFSYRKNHPSSIFVLINETNHRNNFFFFKGVDNKHVIDVASCYWNKNQFYLGLTYGVATIEVNGRLKTKGFATYLSWPELQYNPLGMMFMFHSNHLWIRCGSVVPKLFSTTRTSILYYINNSSPKCLNHIFNTFYPVEKRYHNIIIYCNFQ